METKNVKFVVTGWMSIPADAKPLESYDGEIYGYQLSDGNEITLLAALAVNQSQIFSTDAELNEIGCSVDKYIKADFIPEEG